MGAGVIMLLVRADAGLSYVRAAEFAGCSSESSVSRCSAALNRRPRASFEDETTVLTTSVSRFAFDRRCCKGDRAIDSESTSEDSEVNAAGLMASGNRSVEPVCECPDFRVSEMTAEPVPERWSG